MSWTFLIHFARTRNALAVLLCVSLLITEAAAEPGTVEYTYDAANRLISARYGDDAIIVYAYDAAGNRTKQTVINSSNSGADYDGNGLPDLWEYRYFGTTGVDSGADSDTDGLTNSEELALGSSPILRDTDGDRQDDHAEWVAQTDPADFGSFFQVIAIVGTSPVQLSFFGFSNRVYTLQSSADLAPGGWSDVAGQIRVPGSGGVDSLIDPNPNPTTRKFYRLVVELP